MFKSFVSCEAQAKATIDGTYTPDYSKALLQGNYLHSYYESSEAHQKFIDEQASDLMTKSGSLRADYQLVDKMIDKLNDDDVFLGLYQGDKEVIVTGDVFGQQWKGKIDCLNVEKGYFVDLKTTREIHKNYGTWRQPHNFIDEYDYSLQLGVYKLLLEEKYGKHFTPYIVAISKEQTPEAALYKFNDDDFDDDYLSIQSYQDHVKEVIDGLERPTRCERCPYCKLTGCINTIHNSHYL